MTSELETGLAPVQVHFRAGTLAVPRDRWGSAMPVLAVIERGWEIALILARPPARAR